MRFSDIIIKSKVLPSKMAESYIGVRFRSEIIGTRDSSGGDQALIHWSKELARLGLAPDYGSGNAGNISCRVDGGFLITPTACHYADMRSEDLCLIVSLDWQKKLLRVRGKRDPSSEAFLHALIYEKRADVRAIIHGHSDAILGMHLPCTSDEKPYGTLELAHEVEKILGQGDILLMKNHGFICLGKDLDDAGNRMVKLANGGLTDEG